jgi:Ca2+-binding EF-hand superfamily protein
MDKKVSYEEFIKPLIGELNGRRLQYIETAFKLIDKDNNGLINNEDIARAFDGWKHPEVKQGVKRQEDLLHDVLEILQLCTTLKVFLG